MTTLAHLARRASILLMAVAALPGPRALAVQDPAPTAEDVAAEFEALQAADPEDKEETLALYRAALDALERSGQATQRADQLASDAAGIPAQVEALKKELAAPPAEVGSELDPQATLEEVEAQLTRWIGVRAGGQSELAERQQEIEARTARLPAVAAEISKDQRRIDELQGTLRGVAEGSVRASAELPARAELEALVAEVAALEAEKVALAARKELLPLQRDRAQRQVAEAELEVEFWQAQVNEKREQETKAAALEAQRKREETAASFPRLSSLAARNEELAALRSELTQRLAQAQLELTESEQLERRISERHRITRRTIASGGLTEGMGRILRRDFEWLPTDAALRARAAEQGVQLSKAQYELITIEDERSEVGDPVRATSRFLASLVEAAPEESLAALALELHEAQRELHNAVIEDLGSLTTLLHQEVQVGAALRQSAAAYRVEVQGQIFWVRSAAANPLPSFAALPRHLLEVRDSIVWKDVYRDVEEDLRARPIAAGVLALLLVTLVASRRFLERKRAEMAGLVRSYRTDRFFYTVRALDQSLLLALPLPMVFWVLGWILSTDTVAVVQAAGGGLRQTSGTFLGLEFLRQLARPKGLGEGHFRWPGKSMAVLRRELGWYEPVAVAIGLVVSTFGYDSALAWTDSIGRAAVALQMLALALFLQRLLRPGGHLFSDAFLSSKGVLGRTHGWWSGLWVSVPAILTVLALGGYIYTAMQLGNLLRYSMMLAVGLTLVNAVLLRWLFVTRRRLAVAQAQEKAREQAAAAAAAEEAGGDAAAPPFDEDRIDIPAVDAQTRQLFKSGVTIATVVGLYLIWSTALPALEGLESVQVWPRVGIIHSDEVERAMPATTAASAAPATAAPQLPGMRGLSAAPAGEEASGLPVVLTLADIAFALIALMLTLVASRNVPGVLEISLLQRLPLDSGSRYAVTTIVRYLILIFGTSATLGAVGLGWDQIQWLAAALTFGLAFGLQEIFANFVSGIIILLERPVRLGDIVTVGTTTGRVTRLRMRSTTIQDWDHLEYLIPNKEFITSSVVNWTLSDPVTRIVIPVGIAYGSDTERAHELLLEVADANPLVLAEPPPSALFRRFGESSLDFDLRIFIANRDLWLQVMHRLHTEIDRAFRKAHIEIAFPQRDIHVRSAEGLAQAGLEGPGAKAEPE